MKRFSVKLFLFVSVALFSLFLFSPDIVQRSAYESVLFCISVLVPSLFPGFVLSDLIIGLSSFGDRKTKGLFSLFFRLPSACMRCWFIGLLAGFPSAADCVTQMVLSGKISKNEAERCLAFTNNPGIVFVVCAVGGGLFGSYAIGIYLWLIQTFSALLVGFLVAEPRIIESKPIFTPVKSISLNRIFPKAVVSSVSAVLNICGFVVFFRVLISVLTSALPLDEFQVVLSGLLEMTCGISFLKEFTFSSAVFASFMLGWSGFSVHFQILNVISSVELSPKYYFPGKVLQGCFSAGLTAFTYPMFFGAFLPSTAGLTILIAVVVLSIILTIRFRKEFLYGKQKLRTGKATS